MGKTVFELTAIGDTIVVVVDCSFSLAFVSGVGTAVFCSVKSSVVTFAVFIPVVEISFVYSFRLFQGSFINKDVPLPWKLLFELKLPVY